ncbi:MAG: beta strand repeat-containing protein, partial [Myxococcaceae bacterium]
MSRQSIAVIAALLLSGCGCGGPPSEPPPPSMVEWELTVSPGTTSLFVGDRAPLAAHWGEDDVTADAEWSSSDASIADVGAGGMVTGRATGGTIIAARFRNLTAKTLVSVTERPVGLTAIRVEPGQATVAAGETLQLTATGTTTGGATLDVTRSVTWASAHPAIATVPPSGLAATYLAGETRITASLAGVKSNEVVLTVTAPKLLSVAVTPAADTVPLGASHSYTATATLTDGSSYEVTSQAVWSTGDPAILGLGAPGTATGTARGSTTLTALFDGMTSAPALIEVVDPVIASIELTPAQATIHKGTALIYLATATWTDGTQGDISTSASWSSSDPAVAPIASGLATGLTLGSTGITAAKDGVVSPPAVLVVDAAVVTSIALSPSFAAIPEGGTQSYLAVAGYSDGTTLDVSGAVVWNTSGPAASFAGGVATGVSAGLSTVSVALDGVVSNTCVLSVYPAVLTSLVIVPTGDVLQVYETRQLTAIGTRPDGSLVDVTLSAVWLSDQPAAATVSSAGLATAVDTGTAHVTATLGGLTSAPCTLVVSYFALTSLSVAPPTASIAIGHTRAFTAHGVFADGSVIDVTGAVAWSSSAVNVASVGAGLAVGLEVGTSTIGASVRGFSAAATLTVTPPVIDSIEVTPAQTSLAKGRTGQLVATAVWSDGTRTGLGGTVTWTSADPAIASVSPVGEVLARQVGSTTVTAGQGTLVSNAANVAVTPAELDALAISPQAPRLAVGFWVQLTATGIWSDGTRTDESSSVAWTSSDPSTATMSATGVVTAAAVGTSQVSATLPGVSAQETVTVTGAVLTSIAVTPNSSTVPAGGVKLALRAFGFFDDGTFAEVTGLATWASLSPTVADVSSSPPTQGLVTSSAAGTARITATLGGFTGNASITVVSATLDELTVAPAGAVVPVGFGLQYQASGAFSDGNSYDLTLSALWSSSDASVAKVSNAFPSNGSLSALSPGTSTIGAAFAGLGASTGVTVSAATLTSIALAPSSVTEPVGYTVPFTASGSFSDGTWFELTSWASWSSANPAVATVGNGFGDRGLASILGEGTTSLSAAAGGLTGSASVTGTLPALKEVIVTPVAPSIGILGTVQLHATAVFTDGSTLDVTPNASWASSNLTIASVRDDAPWKGRVTGHVTGTAVVTATFGQRFGSSQIQVTSATLADIYVSPALPKIGVDTTVQFQASGVWTDGSTGDLTPDVTWSSSAPAVASIGAAGLATGLSGGQTVITASYVGFTDATTLTVTAAPMTSITVLPANRSLPLGIRAQYSATAHYADGITQDLTTQVSWASSSPLVATNSNAGLVSTLTPGSTTVTATFKAVTGGTTLTVRNVTLLSISVTPDGALIPVHYSRQYTAIGAFSDGSTEVLTDQVSWTTDNPSIAVASNSGFTVGEVTGVAAGQVRVIGTVYGFSASVAATVVDWKLCDIVLSPTGASGAVGEPVQISATASFAPDAGACGSSLAFTLDVSNQVGWRVLPKLHATVSNSPGSENMVT